MQIDPNNGLGLLMVAYFHQDWMDEHDDEMDVVRQFCVENPHQVVRGRNDIQRLIDSGLSAEGLGRSLGAMGGFVSFSSDDYSAATFLKESLRVMGECSGLEEGSI
ncbi:MAG: contact-dependent growth inhibition system immunity protein [Planctomycetota bacterium]|jgi:hypothetical protein|nr:contact-dependent growth inhibition system immunity protein [Planctomycetota bacterium]